MIYKDKFSVGDRVTWRDKHYANLTDGFLRFGNGPFVVEDVMDVKKHFRSVGHSQQVVVRNQTFSGAFFRHADRNTD